MHKILYIILFFPISLSINAEMIKPDPTISSKDVISIQLKALQINNSPFEDAGIEQTWEFAHPNNKASTGPLERFKKMIYSDSYKILIEHENNKIIILEELENKLVYKVNILSKDKKRYYYIWQIEKVEQEGILKDCWMTTAVSEPIYLGKII